MKSSLLCMVLVLINISMSAMEQQLTQPPTAPQPTRTIRSKQEAEKIAQMLAEECLAEQDRMKLMMLYVEDNSCGACLGVCCGFTCAIGCLYCSKGSKDLALVGWVSGFLAGTVAHERINTWLARTDKKEKLRTKFEPIVERALLEFQEPAVRGIVRNRHNYGLSSDHN